MMNCNMNDAPIDTKLLCYGKFREKSSELCTLDWYVASKDSNGKWHVFYTYDHNFEVKPEKWAFLPTEKEEEVE